MRLQDLLTVYEARGGECLGKAAALGLELPSALLRPPVGIRTRWPWPSPHARSAPWRPLRSLHCDFKDSFSTAFHDVPDLHTKETASPH